MTLTRDQRAVLGELTHGRSCWVCQDELAALAALGLAVVVDRCWLTERHKYAATEAGRAYVAANPGARARPTNSTVEASANPTAATLAAMHANASGGFQKPPGAQVAPRLDQVGVTLGQLTSSSERR